MKAKKTAIDWKRLEHAYGSAEDLGGVLAALDSAKRDKRLAALVDLEARVAHQYTVYSASAPVVPLLVERLERRAPDGDALARILGIMAWGSGEPASVKAVAEQFDTLAGRVAALVDHDDAAVRINMTNVISSVVRRTSDIAKAVARRLRVEKDPAVLFSIVVAPAFGNCTERAWLAACEAVLDDELPERRLAGATALAVALRDKAPDGVVAPLLAAIESPDPYAAAWVQAPWSRAGIIGDLANAISFLGAARRAAALPVLCAVMEKSSDAPAVAEAISFMAWGAKAPSNVAGLDAAQRSALERIVRCDRAWNARVLQVLASTKLPDSREGIREWLGLEGDGILDRVVKIGKRAPLHEHVARYVWIENKPFAKLVDAAGDQITATEWVEVLADVAGNAHGLRASKSVGDDERQLDVGEEWGPAVKRALRVDRKGTTLLIHARLQRLLAANDSASHLNYLLFSALASVTRGELDPRFDAILNVTTYRPYHPKVPPERLEELVLAHLRSSAAELGEPEKGGWGIGFARLAESGAAFLAKCPTERLAKASLGLAALSGIGGDVVTTIRKLKSRPAIARALAEHDRREEKASSYVAMRKAMAGFVDEVYPPPKRPRKG